MQMKPYYLILLFGIALGQEVNQRYYPRYHLAPPYGWMNDPNGFSIFKNEYHLFYQYNPETSLEPGYAHWGHAKSTDLMTWEHLPIALYPDKDYDLNGVFSGSAIVEDGTMYLYYTTNLNHPGETPEKEQHQALATGTDGVTFTKNENNPIVPNADLQPNIRDPKVWKHGDKYYMVLGNSISDTYGRTLLFTSDDKLNWQQASVLAESNGTLGYMWECPDFFELDGKFILLFSPQGVKPDGDKYNNLYQTGYIIGSFDYETNKFTPEIDFKELDHGHDFYATQTLDDTETGRRVLIAWMDMWEQYYPERQDGFTGLMTLPRTLRLVDGNLIQKPIASVEAATGKVVFNGPAKNNKYIKLNNNAGVINVKAPKNEKFELLISSQNTANSVTLSYDPTASTVTLNRGGDDGVRRTQWVPKGDSLIWSVYVDASSVELFCGEGEVTFSSRFFPEGQVSVRVGSSSPSTLSVRDMHTTVPKPGKQ